MNDRVLYKRLNDQARNTHFGLVDVILHRQPAAKARLLDLHILLNLLQLTPDVDEFVSQLQIVAHIA
ncbi:hypothetical protein D3C74_486950 [compost metagenome]